MHMQLLRWLRISLFNLFLVSFIGVILRYKIVYSLPFVDQKHLLQGHSNFAFTGWITQTLMILLVNLLSQNNGSDYFKRYRNILYANLITSYGILICFPLQGYGIGSISFLVLSIISNYIFVVRYWKDASKILASSASTLLIKASLLFNVVSSIGSFALTYLMANKINFQNGYLAAVYFFLHFQYNGWFSFAILGLFFNRLDKIPGIRKDLKLIFWLFFLACWPAYLLSALWLPIPKMIYWIVVAAAVTQVVAVYIFINVYKKNQTAIKNCLPTSGRWLFILASIAFSIKIFLQLGSTIPALSQLAFGFRPIVIGYLHLILLGVITISLLGFIFSYHLVDMNKSLLKGTIIFIAGIIFNEILLMTQGFAALGYHIIPFINESLLVTACIMFSGLFWMNINNKIPLNKGHQN